MTVKELTEKFGLIDFDTLTAVEAEKRMAVIRAAADEDYDADCCDGETFDEEMKVAA